MGLIEHISGGTLVDTSSGERHALELGDHIIDYKHGNKGKTSRTEPVVEVIRDGVRQLVTLRDYIEKDF